MKVKDLRKVINQLNDEDEVGIKIGGEIYDCFAYDDEWCRQQGHPCLVIEQE